MHTFYLCVDTNYRYRDEIYTRLIHKRICFSRRGRGCVRISTHTHTHTHTHVYACVCIYENRTARSFSITSLGCTHAAFTLGGGGGQCSEKSSGGGSARERAIYRENFSLIDAFARESVDRIRASANTARVCRHCMVCTLGRPVL